MRAPSAANRPAVTTAANVAATAAALSLLAFLFNASSMWALVLFRLLTDGLIALCWLASATGLGLCVLWMVRVRPESSVLHAICAAAVGLGGLSLAMLGLGLLGWANRPAAVALMALGILSGAARLLPSMRAHIMTPRLSTWAWLWLLPAVVLGLALACAMVPPGILWGDEPNGYDIVEYHFQAPREWYESGRIAPLEHNVFSYFPFNVEMHYLLAMLLRGGPWRGMYLAQLMHVCFIALAVAGVWGVLRELHSPRATLGAMAAGCVPWMGLLAPIGYNEGGLLLFGGLAVGLMIIAARSRTPLRFAALAGAMAGFACGAKLTAIPMVLLALPVASLAFARVLGGSRFILTWAMLLFMGTVTFAPWLIRNAAWTGNPFFPEATRVFGRGHFSEEQAERWRTAHTLREDQAHPLARLNALRKQVLTDWRYGFVLLPLMLAALAAEPRRQESLYLSILVLIMLAFWLLFTHLQGRFLVLLIPIAGLAIGLVRRPAVSMAVSVLAAISAALGLAILHGQLLGKRPIFQLAGLEDLSVLTPLADVTVLPEDRVVLVGDARAFLYPQPMSRLSYRTVFDVDAKESDTAVDAWLHDVEIVTGSTLVLIDPNELRRFARTYRHIPPLPPELADQHEPLILRR